MAEGDTKNPGYVKVIKCDLISGSRKLDIIPYVPRIDVYESILASGVICEIIIADATGIFSHFGNDIIDLEFTTFEDAPSVKYKLRIVKTGPGSSNSNEKSTIYKITCVSEESYKAMTIKNLPLVRNKDILAEEAVLNMLKDVLKTEKEVYIEKTTGLHMVSSAGKSPFEFINEMRKIAVSEKHKASAYVFFENKNGYHFKSLEKLVEEGKEKVGDKVYIFHNLANIDVKGSNWRTIIGAKQLQVGNENVAALIGGNLNSSTEFDILTGKFVEFEDPASASFEAVSMNENSVWIDTKRINEFKETGRVSIVAYDSSSEKHTVAEKENYLPYYISKFLTVIQHITVYGDTTVTIGDIIKVTFPERTGLTKEIVEMDPNLSGNYMVCKCRHVLLLADQPTYFQAFEIIKDGLGGDLPKIRSGS